MARNIVVSGEWVFLIFMLSSLALFFASGGYFADSSWVYNVSYVRNYYGGFVVMSLIGFLFGIIAAMTILVFFNGVAHTAGSLRGLLALALFANVALWIVALVMMCIVGAIAFCIIVMIWSFINFILGIMTFVLKSGTTVTGAGSTAYMTSGYPQNQAYMAPSYPQNQVLRTEEVVVVNPTL